MGIRNVLLLKRKDTCYSLMDDDLFRLKTEMENKGVHVDVAESPEDEKTAEDLLFTLLSQKDYDAALGIEEDTFKSAKREGRYLFDLFGVPLFNWEIDHPFERFVDYEDHPAQYHILCIDRNHAKLVREIYPEIKSVSFVPLPGYEAADLSLGDERDYAEREMDVIVTGSCFPAVNVEQALAGVDGSTQLFVIRWIESLIDHRELTSEEVLRKLMEEETFHVPIPFSEFAKSLRDFGRFVVMYTRSFVREELIRYLLEADVKVDIFGTGWDGIVQEYDSTNVTLHKPVSYDRTAGLYQKGKILLNTMPWFKDGYHDRICTGLLSGTAVLTDPTKFLEEVYRDEEEGREIYFYDIKKPWEVPEIIGEMLKHPEELYASACRGKKKTKERFSWERVTETILDIMEQSAGK